MQFKHPEILWALFLLVIPVAIHLFQLRRFARTPFTNVAMLQKVVSDSRKSSSLKKWLLLFTRLLLLAALILAFAQPFTAPAQAQGERETVIYLDNSFSMQARSQGMSLLDRAVQELIKGLEQDSPLSLFTNDGTFGDVTLADIRNSLLDLAHTQEQLDISQINLKAQTLFSKSGDATKHLIVISDFQQSLGPFQLPGDSTIIVHYVPQRPDHLDNISVDSVYLEEAPTGEQASLGVLLSGGEKDLALPVSLYNGEALIAKTAATFKGDGTAQMAFSIPAQQALDGRVAITDRGLGYDNNFYFSIDRPDRIKVLALVEGEGEYLDRLFAEDPFELKKYTLDQLDHSALVGQNTILIDQLGGLPDNLQLALQGFVGQGGNLILVPPVDLEVSSYNRLLASLGGGRFTERVDVESPLTEIVYGHPLFSDVFQGQVDNFQYPTVRQHYKFSSDLPKILGLEGGDAFLSGREGLYVFSAGLDPGNTNFKNSPLIVPTFYKMAMAGAAPVELYYVMGAPLTVFVQGNMGPNDILKVSKAGYGFIPLQQAYPERIRLTFDQDPTEDGNYGIGLNDRPLKRISFNYPRSESQLRYMDLSGLQGPRIMESIGSLVEDLEAQVKGTAYWKWFVILALLLLLVEVLIQKFVSWKSY